MKYAVYGLVTCAIALAAAYVLISDRVSAQQAEYAGESSCKVCHNKAAEGAQWDKWKAEKHAQAFALLKSDEAKAVGEKLGLAKAPHESKECLQCHVTSYNVETGAVHAKIKMDLGVQCETCHGPGGEHAKDAGKFMTKPDKTGMIRMPFTPNAETCVNCHSDKSPTWKADRYTLADGTKVGFDFEQAWAKIEHSNPLKKK